MAISIVGTPQFGAATNGNDVTLTFDGSPAADDYVLVFGGHGDAVTDFSNGEPESSASAADYTQIFVHTGSAPVSGVWYKKLTGADTQVICYGSGNNADATAYCSYVLRGCDTTTFQDVSRTLANGTSTNPNCASITPTTSGAWVFAIASSAVNDANVTAPSGYTSLVNDNGNDNNDITTAGARIAWTSGAEDPASFTGWASGAWRAVTVAVRPAINNSPASGTATLATLTASGTAGNPPLTASGTVNLETLTSSGLARRYSGAPGKTTAEFVIWTSRSRRHLRLPQLPWAGVAGSKTASGTPTLAALTASGTVTQQQTVTGTATLEALTSSGTASLGALSASGTPSLEALTSTGSVTQQQTVTGTATLATLTASGTAGLLHDASGTPSLESPTATGTVTQQQVVTGTATLDALTASGTVTQQQTVTGTATLETLTASGTVTQQQTLTGSVTLEVLTASGTVTQQQVVTGTATLQAITASGLVTNALLASGTPSVPTLTASGTITQVYKPSGTANLAGPTATGSVTQQQTVTGTATLAELTSTGTATLGGLEASGTPSLASPTASGTVTQQQTVTGTPSVPTLTASGTAGLLHDASGTPTLSELTATASVTQEQVVTGTASLESPTSSGSVTQQQVVTGTATLSTLTASGTALNAGDVSSASGTPTLEVLTASGTVTQKQVVTGSASVPVLTATGLARPAQDLGPGHYTASFVIRWSDSRKHQQWIKPPSTPLSPTLAERAGYFPASARVEANRFSFERHHLESLHPAEYPASDAPPEPSFAAWDLRGWLSQLETWKEVGQYLQLNALGVFEETDPNYYSGWGMAFATTPRAFRTSFKRRHQAWPMPESFPATPTTEPIIPAYFAPKQHRRHEKRKIVYLPQLDERPRTIQSAAAYAPVKTIKRRETARILQFPLELNSRPQTPPVAEQPMTAFLAPVQYRRRGWSKLVQLAEYPEGPEQVFPSTVREAVNHVWYWDRYRHKKKRA